jgi:hypothetical protein
MEELKKIDICGTANRYAVKKLINDKKQEKETRRRVVSQNWNFSSEYYEYEYQINILKNIFNQHKLNNEDKLNNEVSKIMVQEINKKIYNYKQQDLLKKHFDQTNFINFENIIQKMIDTGLKCRYCDCKMLVLYDFSRELKQWSVDRIDNDLGHNNDNFHLACLDCNLKRRRRSDEKFLFTKKLNLVKQDN